MLKRIDLSKAAAFFKNVTLEKHLNMMRSFFMGKWYPIWIAFSVLIGRVTCLEVYFAMIDIVLASIALLVCDSLRPVLPNLITFLYRIPIEHSPGYPTYSTYYSELNLGAFWALFAMFFAVLVYFYIKNKIFAEINLLKTPLMVSLSVFSLSLLTAGMFSGRRAKEDLGFTLLEVFVFFVVYLILYYGLRHEKVDELLDYFTYICAMCVIVLSLEVLDVFLRIDGAFVDGVVYKSSINFGWGISNSAGNALVVLIPICILGAMRSERYSVAYFAVATLALISTFFTLARNSALIGIIGFVICALFSCFGGKNKRICRICAVVVAFVALLVCILIRKSLMQVFSHYLINGFDNNGRYYLWDIGLGYFKENPIFGNGFFYVTEGPKLSEFTPSLVHNTFIQLLVATGVFGFAAYIFYRVCSMIPFIKKFTAEKFMLLACGGFMVVASLIDNFIFWFNPTFVYNICIVLAIMHCEQTPPKRGELKDTDDACDDVACDNIEKTSLVKENI